MTSDLAKWQQKESSAAAELDQLRAERARLVAELEQLEAAAAANLANVPAEKLAATAEKQAAARARVDGIALAVAELDRRIGVQSEQLKQIQNSVTARLVEAEQARIDDLARAALTRLQAALAALEETRAAEQSIFDRYSRTARVVFPASFVEAIRHRIDQAERELA